jgi:hypothetical protein
MVVLAPVANAQAENGLLGIKLFDASTKVVQIFGSPNRVEAVNVGGGGAAGGGGGGFGGPPGAGGGAARGGGSGASAPTSDFFFGTNILRQFGGRNDDPGLAGGPPAAMGGPQGGPPGFGPGGPGPGMPGGRGSMGPGAPGGGGGAAENAVFTRWVYNRDGCRYGFIINQQGQVVQIEAIGLNSPRARTNKGVRFGSTFGDIIRLYNNPDGYDIAGDNILMRFLNRNNVAFRLSRLGAGKPQVVTGIVVSAGKG